MKAQINISKGEPVVVLRVDSEAEEFTLKYMLNRGISIGAHITSREQGLDSLTFVVRPEQGRNEP